MFNIKFKKLHSDAKIPSRAHDVDSGFDVYSIEDHTLHPGTQYRFKLGIASEMPERVYFWGIGDSSISPTEYYPLSMSALFWDKSSIGKMGIKVMGGVIDPNYTGEWSVMLRNLSGEPYHFSKGSKLCQVILTPVFLYGAEEVFALKETERGESGFGSSGTH